MVFDRLTPRRDGRMHDNRHLACFGMCIDGFKFWGINRFPTDMRIEHYSAKTDPFHAIHLCYRFVWILPRQARQPGEPLWVCLHEFSDGIVDRLRAVVTQFRCEHTRRRYIRTEQCHIDPRCIHVFEFPLRIISIAL